MYKNIIRATFLFATGIFMTACSSGDDELADSRTPVTPDTKENTVTLTGTICTGSDITRAVDADGKSVYWQVNDEICVQYTSKDGITSVKGKITEVNVNSDTHLAKFTATLTNLAPNLTTTNIGLAYPYSNVTAGGSTVTDFSFDNSLLYSQVGTIDGINNAKLDVAWTTTEVGITIDKANATLNNDAILTNQVCICKFNVKDGGTALKARALEITLGENTTPDYKVIPDDDQSVFYVALPAISGKVKIEASTCGDYGAMVLDSEDIIKSMKSTDVGKYISVDASNQAYLCKNLTTTPSTVSTAKICKHTYSSTKLLKGKFYELDLAATSQDLTPIAVVASVGEVSGYWDYFLALALEDATASVVSVVDGEASAEAFASNNKVKINGTLYEKVAARDGHQPYDRVYDNIFSGGSYTSKGTDFGNWVSSATSGSALEGWRVPAVTDWRYIIQHFGGRSATLPKGIGDHDAKYPIDLNSIEGETAMHYDQGSAQQLENFVAVINTACGNPSTLPLRTNYYWSASELDSGQETEKAQGVKIWRYNFSSGVFEWNSGGTLGDNSYIRLVLAY